VRIVLALVACLLASSRSDGQILDTPALNRALKFGLDFQSGIIDTCTRLELTGGEIWLVLKVHHDDANAFLERQDRVDEMQISFKDMNQMSRIQKVLSYRDRLGPACVIFD
jgi:hypothetical protein